MSVLNAPAPSGDTTGATDSAVIQDLIDEASDEGLYTGNGVAVHLQDGIYYGHIFGPDMGARLRRNAHRAPRRPGL
jgi:hypothetical protein